MWKSSRKSVFIVFLGTQLKTEKYFSLDNFQEYN